MTVETVLVALLLAFGYLTGINGVTIKPFIHPPAKAAHHAAAPKYVCPPHIQAALRAGSQLDPAVFCTKK